MRELGHRSSPLLLGLSPSTLASVLRAVDSFPTPMCLVFHCFMSRAQLNREGGTEIETQVTQQDGASGEDPDVPIPRTVLLVPGPAGGLETSWESEVCAFSLLRKQRVSLTWRCILSVPFPCGLGPATGTPSP